MSAHNHTDPEDTVPDAMPDLFYVYDHRPADSGPHSTVRDLVAMPCEAGGIRTSGETVPHIGDGDCRDDINANQLGAIRWSEHLGIATMLYVHPRR
ncbi:hypothetical protein HDA32_005822 [Spinactinospora alkalitolerans]|uniref:Uncharacterized protein n=1 Tax=Spinactinospora alkalitolerans TaxID=687207 RepID=A0A852U5C2_9ACTN|nr:hypothetical protein [Spinactinospora alkalitolerans]NYE50702.1 hypothetical protein [Spinactinospora alkalitolerans]